MQYRRGFKQESGATLLEIMLVLAIAAALIVMALRQYQVMQMDAYIRQARYNIDTLFQAAAKYYQVNCDKTTGSDGTEKMGTLNPLTTSATIYPVWNSTSGGSLATEHYLIETLPSNPIVDTYAVQFVRHDADRTFQTITGSKKIGTIVIWNIQVTVGLRDTSKANLYLGLLRGDCLSTSINPTGSCFVGAQASGTFIVFERLPSFALAQNETTYWLAKPLVKQFKQMYTTYPIQYLLNTSGQTPAGEQYFLCGG
ncbi:MAG: hypothetical protein A3F42_02005 [Gammaproteobacteria bacterium RIFCSPHIGHO2_12_FULL_37_34]|nr:MAG: hypothetical protein A3F42_02005 [Gammaproteobacteria bacterium RIFCSPHIGHO2_12_FULL_37_34]